MSSSGFCAQLADFSGARTQTYMADLVERHVFFDPMGALKSTGQESVILTGGLVLLQPVPCKMPPLVQPDIWFADLFQPTKKTAIIFLEFWTELHALLVPSRACACARA
eukprot:scaffold186279_cov16-Tisochrysis_lutea.AAC.1